MSFFTIEESSGSLFDKLLNQQPIVNSDGSNSSSSSSADDDDSSSADGAEFFNFYQEVRRKKNKIKEKLERQRLRLEEFEKMGHHNGKMSAAESKFYEQYYKSNEQLKTDLNNLRLLGDAFIAESGGKLYLINISHEGKLYIYPRRAPFDQLQSREKNEKNGVTMSEARFNAVMLKNNNSSITGSKLAILIDRIASTSILQNTFKQDGFEGVALMLKDNSHILMFTNEKHELLEVIGAHLKRANKHRLKQVSELSQTLKLKEDKYDSENEAHENMLMDLWHTVFPHEKLRARKTKQWEQIGFQGEDPATDFRAMGLLGLKLVIYLQRGVRNRWERF